MKFNKLSHFYLLAIAVIVIDQIIKVVVHLNMDEHTGFNVLGISWLQIHYVTNPGMAFGMTLGGAYGKIILSLFRLVAVTAIGFYMAKMFKKQVSKGLQLCVALIFGGAIGNLVDSIFYGFFSPRLLVDDAPFTVFHGKVVDMFFVDIYKGIIELPIVGRIDLWLWPIFNFADASIFVAVCVIVIFQKKFFKEEETAV